jgi:hypothetical protein
LHVWYFPSEGFVNAPQQCVYNTIAVYPSLNRSNRNELSAAYPSLSTCVAFRGSMFFFLSFLLLAIVLSVLFDECGIWLFWLFMSFVSTNFSYTSYRGRRGHDHMVVGFTTTCVISVYHLSSCELEPCSWQDVLNTTLCDSLSVTSNKSGFLWVPRFPLPIKLTSTI